MTNRTEETETRKDIGLGHSLDRLMNNPDFQDVVLDGYINNTLMNTSRHCMSADGQTRQQTIEEIMAVSYLRNYFVIVANQASTLEAE